MSGESLAAQSHCASCYRPMKLKQLTQGELSWASLGGAVVGNPPAKAGVASSSPGLGRSHMPRSN